MKKRVIALLLCVVMLATTMGAGVFMPPDIKIIDADANEAVSAVAVPQSERVKLTTDYQSSNELGFQWQLSADGKAWVNIYGQTGSSILLSYAMVCNMLSEDGTAQVRCIVTDGDSEYESRAAEVSIDYSAPARIAKAPARAAAVQNDAAPADASDAESGQRVFVIKYIFEDGTQAANDWTATVPENDTTYTATVTSPTVVGYTPDQAVVDVNNSQTEYTVTYYPAEVNYTVNHYQQNIDNDNYTLTDTETKIGVTKSQVGDKLQKTYDGFTALLYDTTTKIAADGSTVIEIYYDRNYYLLSLDLDGGYGAEPMYARYGTTISIANPTKAGYAFAGWKPDMPTTMPAENKSLKAQWTANDTAKVTVVFWGENADDEEYSYYSDASVFLKPGTECTINSINGALICGKEEHTHTLNCYSGVREKDSWSYAVSDSSPYNGKVKYVNYFMGSGHDGYHIYWDGTWYYCEETTRLVCGKEEHTHSEACKNGNFDPKLWTLNKEKSQSVAVAADGTTIFNVYYDRVKFKLDFQVSNRNNWSSVYSAQVKWGADTTEYWNTAPSGYLWYTTKNGSTFYTNAPAMPQNDLTIYGRSSSGSSTVHYREKGTEKEIRKSINVANSNWSFTTEDYIAIPGFTYDSSSKNNRNYYVYYTRNSYELSFFNYNANVEDKTESVQYEASLSGKNFTPEYPKDLEANAYEFAGWYTTAGCYTGSEVDWSKDTMPANNLKLYAKWAPVTHTVNTYLTKNAMDSGNDPLDTWSNVPHRTAIENPPETPENGNYTFVGWFYMDNGVEKAFDFSMPVTKDLDLYAKWSSNTLVKYTIKYTLEDGTEIAPPTNGSALAGATKTFDAKAGTALNEGYQSGYFPKTNSHSLTMNIEGGNEFTFVYVAKPEVNYTVRYLEKGTNAVLHEEKTGASKAAVITEQFVAVKGYAPDAYQKKLVLSAEDSENVLTFWYTKDNVHAPVQIIHWKQNIAGDDYTEYRSSTDLNGVIGKTYTETALDLAGFKYDEGKSESSGTLTAEGLVLNLYYDRIAYPYEFRFLEQRTDKELAEPTTGNARYQAQVTQSAITIPGYKLVSAGNQAITIAIEDPADTASKNVKIFYYVEETVDIKYQIVGPKDCGTLTQYSENVKAVTGNPVGSTASTANDTYKFVGWYLDEACTKPVDTDWVNGTTILPQKTKDYDNNTKGYESATYYAKFELNLTSMTLKKVATPYDANDMFIFTVTDSKGNEFAKVALKAGEEVKLDGLTVGETYTVSEDNNWSWRYANQDPKEITINSAESKNVVTVTNTVENNKWLGASSYAINKCLDTVSSQISAFFAKLFN